MSRPDVSVVMPFAGDATQAQAALDALRSLRTSAGDELILADNAGLAPVSDLVNVISASGEPSPAHARNAGAGAATKDWILFLDADCLPPAGLLDAYFSSAIDEDVGAVVGEVHAAPGAGTLTERYGAARGFLGQRAHLEHPFAPRAAAANLLVRRSAFEQLGGFFEGVRAAEDTDFSWRLQRAGWRLELRPEAWVEHRYRTTLSQLRSQWRGYAAGRAWLARRYDGFLPRPAVARAVERARARVTGAPASPRGAPPAEAGPARRGSFMALDVLLSLEELVGLSLSNRPARGGDGAPEPPEVVLIADRFPARDDPLVELASALHRVRVEALGRPSVPDLMAMRGTAVDYLEDDGAAARLAATVALALRHPVRVGADRWRHGAAEPPLRVLAPAVQRLERDAGARVHSLGGGVASVTAARLAALAGRELGR